MFSQKNGDDDGSSEEHLANSKTRFLFDPKIFFLLKYLNSISCPSPCSIFPLLLVDPELSTF
jgi:hypothetical protein